MIQINDKRALQYQKVDCLLQIQIETVSGIDKNSQKYDFNSGFAYIYLQPAPFENLKFNVFFENDKTRKQLSKRDNIVWFDFDSQQITNYSQSDEDIRFIILLNDNSFQFEFEKGCKSVKKDLIPINNPLLDSQYKCTVDIQTNSLIILLKPQAIQATKYYRIEATIKNPSFVIQNIGVQLRMLRDYSPHILSIGNANNIFETSPINLASYKVSFGWDVLPSQQNPFKMIVVRGDKKDASYIPFNSFKFRFILDIDTPEQQELRVILKLKTEPDDILLAGSIKHNFPGFNVNPQQVKDNFCREYNKDTSDKRKLICSSIGQLKKIKNIIFHLKFQKTYPQNAYSIKSKNGRNWVPQETKHKFTQVSSINSSKNLINFNPTTDIGIKGNNQIQKLVFCFQAPYTDAVKAIQYDSLADKSFNDINNVGMNIIMNPKFSIQQSSVSVELNDSTVPRVSVPKISQNNYSYQWIFN
ncbi:hypothetical protein IMG5_173790 [Ichthyophthirius multifiliis]|uniref:Uncharacterized protein n=1 Tax=Ichthyophthirius multifiliis TaxID=5932 RepID=G0R1Z8_ICHMU|nr:hypothetical protein IMG5_173790 [Ichthyophthirius multifiliis]EGR28523.1 hypothetical protein IMG5_173790 [Ichthyophthirius multifiliis]|eukprot:XP_004029759.1 hypothetical protein IMG5_173790 [Ichthyophthirius multifiliis]